MLEHLSMGDITDAQITRRGLPDGFNWFAILKDLKAGAPCSREDYSKMVHMAGVWTTCACGQLCKNLPRNYDGCPQDTLLHAYGVEFLRNIQDKNWGSAIETLHDIEARTMDLLSRSEYTEEVYVRTLEV